MKDLRRVLVRPLITEKGTALKEANKYLFEVHRSANKVEIRRAIEQAFKVTVLRVHTVAARGKRKRLGKFVGKTPDWKKAIATLKPGDTIEVLEGA
jgi:large subunit ribosomal protein L23